MSTRVRAARLPVSSQYASVLIIAAVQPWFVSGWSQLACKFPLLPSGGAMLHPVRTQSSIQTLRACYDARKVSRPPWWDALQIAELDGGYIDQISQLHALESGEDPRVRYLTELDKAASGKSECVVAVAPATVLQEAGIQLPLPSRENSQELQNLFEMVSMGMMTDEAFQAAVEQKSTQALAGFIVVGAVDVLLYSLTDAKGDTRAYVSNMIVRQPCRGNGVGALLLAKAESRGREAGADQGTLHVHVENEAALRLYSGAGYLRVDSNDEAAAHARSVQNLVQLELTRGHQLMTKALD